MRLKGRSKYGAVRTTVDGVVFHSKREAARYQELRLLEKAGEIRNLELQPVYSLHVPALWRMPNKDAEFVMHGVGEWRGDFRYEERMTEHILTRRECTWPGQVVEWKPVTEDAKGVKTPVYRLKKRMVEGIYGIKIREV